MADDPDVVASLRLALKDAEEARDEARAEAAALRKQWQDGRREEQHRLRNIFSVIRTVARRTGDEVGSVEDYCGILDGRLRSYLRIQAAVAQDWDKGTDLALLLGGELLTFGLREGETAELSGPSVCLTSRAAGLIGLAFHELASAAIMSGRMEEDGGILRVQWNFGGEEASQSLLIDWTEDGPDFADGKETPSFWPRWIEQAIVHQLGGTMTVDVGGGKYRVQLVLPRSALC